MDVNEGGNIAAGLWQTRRSPTLRRNVGDATSNAKAPTASPPPGPDRRTRPTAHGMFLRNLPCGGLRLAIPQNASKFTTPIS